MGCVGVDQKHHNGVRRSTLTQMKHNPTGGWGLWGCVGSKSPRKDATPAKVTVRKNPCDS